MNLFSDTLLRDTVQYMSKPITLNPDSEFEYMVQGFTTNATLSPNSSYHLHAANEFKRGDVLMLTDNDYYIVTGDVVFERGAKYKAILDYCNYENVIIEKVKTDEIVGRQPNGAPIYKTENKIVGLFVGVFRHREVSIANNQIITVANTETILTLKDTPKARETYAINKVFTFDNVEWTVREVMTTKIGLLELRLMSV
ncbi:hypothetical protein MKX47_11755 [Solibacillus sp. FSL R7-0668]|uniref:hypothetical protein n=1 Tax=Solibacillus sp. FSL R7-0668 TaxID=2921688 RepID=UPI0030FB1CCA